MRKKKINICVNNKYNIQTYSSLLIFDLKTLIVENNTNEVVLRTNEFFLDDDTKSLQDYGITNNTNIDVIVKMRGGKKKKKNKKTKKDKKKKTKRLKRIKRKRQRG